MLGPSEFLLGLTHQARGLNLDLVSPCDLAYPVGGNAGSAIKSTG